MVMDSSAVEWTMARSQLIDSLKMAIQGNYHVITELIRVMPDGVMHKRVVDQAIDYSDALINHPGAHPDQQSQALCNGCA